MIELVEFLERVEFWHWWMLAALLVAIEMLVPSTVLLWPGIAAVVVGLVLLVAPDIGWQVQILLFAILSIASLLAWRVYVRARPTHTEDSLLNRRAEQYVGRLFTLEEPIVNRRGKLMADGMRWTMEGSDLESGTLIRVVGTDGLVLKVEQAQNDPDPDDG